MPSWVLSFLVVPVSQVGELDVAGRWLASVWEAPGLGVPEHASFPFVCLAPDSPGAAAFVGLCDSPGAAGYAGPCDSGSCPADSGPLVFKRWTGEEGQSGPRLTGQETRPCVCSSPPLHVSPSP